MHNHQAHGGGYSVAIGSKVVESSVTFYLQVASHSFEQLVAVEVGDAVARAGVRPGESYRVAALIGAGQKRSPGFQRPLRVASCSIYQVVAYTAKGVESTCGLALAGRKKGR